MSRILVVGAGLSGCTVAYKLACNGLEVVLIEKRPEIGGRVRSYGCKAVNKCQNCGVCLSSGLWEKILQNSHIDVMTNTVLKDIIGEPGCYQAAISSCGAEKLIDEIDAIAICTGFDSQSKGLSSHLHIESAEGIITGTQLESLLQGRTRETLFETAPKSVAFIQCLGSRDRKEGGMYCSRVCCAYSTRSAKVIKSYYPDCEIVFFYMELQNVQTGDYYSGLLEQGMEFIKCRPIKVIGGEKVGVEYDDPATGMSKREFDLVVLSDGIHEGADNESIAEICGLGLDDFGFLKQGSPGSGIYVSGCARMPMKIGEAYADAEALASKISAVGADVPGRPYDTEDCK